MPSVGAIRGRGAPPVAGRGRGRSASAGAGRGRGRGASAGAGRGRGRGRGRGISPTASPARAAFVAPVYASPTANLIQQNNRGLASLAAGAVQRTLGYDISATTEQYADVATESVVVTASAVGEFLNSPPGHVVIGLGVAGAGTVYGMRSISTATWTSVAGMALFTGLGTAAGNTILSNSMLSIAGTAISQLTSRRQPPP